MSWKGFSQTPNEAAFADRDTGKVKFFMPDDVTPASFTFQHVRKGFISDVVEIHLWNNGTLPITNVSILLPPDVKSLFVKRGLFLEMQSSGIVNPDGVPISDDAFPSFIPVGGNNIVFGYSYDTKTIDGYVPVLELDGVRIDLQGRPILPNGSLAQQVPSNAVFAGSYYYEFIASGGSSIFALLLTVDPRLATLRNNVFNPPQEPDWGADDSVKIGDIPANCARKLFFRVNIPDESSIPVGSLNLKIHTSYLTDEFPNLFISPSEAVLKEFAPTPINGEAGFIWNPLLSWFGNDIDPITNMPVIKIAGASSYDVYRYKRGIGNAIEFLRNAPNHVQTSQVDAGLTTTPDYAYAVIPIMLDGKEGGALSLSMAVAATTLPVLPNTGLTNFGWDLQSRGGTPLPTGTISFNIYRAKGNAPLTFLANTTFFAYTDSGLENNAIYNYEVHAVNIIGNEILNDLLIPPRFDIFGISLTATPQANKKIQLQWNAISNNADIQRYNILRGKKDSQPEFIGRSVVNPNFLDAGLEGSTQYWYAVFFESYNLNSSSPPFVTHVGNLTAVSTP